MMKKLAFALSLLAAPALAQDFSEGSTAKSWNLYAEVPATFEAKVVDVLCEFTGDCPTDCGAGKRQMGLLRSADNVLVMTFKNNQPAFSGSAVDLAPYCGMTINVDGLMLDDPDLGAKNMYMVQKIQVDGGEWKKASQFTKVWKKETPDASGKGPWFRRDPRIQEQIATHGYMGLGPDVDKAFIADWY